MILLKLSVFAASLVLCPILNLAGFWGIIKVNVNFYILMIIALVVELYAGAGLFVIWWKFPQLMDRGDINGIFWAILAQVALFVVISSTAVRRELYQAERRKKIN